jgi:hypothetical protein
MISVLVIITPKETSSSSLPPTPPVVTAAAAPIHTYPRAAAAAVAATILFLGHRSRRPHSIEIPPKHEKRQNLRQNKTHYENITH